MRVSHISEKALSKFHESTDIPMSEEKVKTSNVVDFA